MLDKILQVLAPIPEIIKAASRNLRALIALEIIALVIVAIFLFSNTDIGLKAFIFSVFVGFLLFVYTINISALPGRSQAKSLMLMITTVASLLGILLAYQFIDKSIRAIDLPQIFGGGPTTKNGKGKTSPPPPPIVQSLEKKGPWSSNIANGRLQLQVDKIQNSDGLLKIFIRLNNFTSQDLKISLFFNEFYVSDDLGYQYEARKSTSSLNDIIPPSGSAGHLRLTPLIQDNSSTITVNFGNTDQNPRESLNGFGEKLTVGPIPIPR